MAVNGWPVRGCYRAAKRAITYESTSNKPPMQAALIVLSLAHRYAVDN